MAALDFGAERRESWSAAGSPLGESMAIGPDGEEPRSWT